MAELDELIEARETEVKCWHCNWRDTRTLSWLSAQRDMTCPECLNVIVLDTSQVRREIARQRKQLTALREQMTLMLGTSTGPRRPQRPQPFTSAAPKRDLALARMHPDTLSLSSRPRRS